MVIYFSWSEFIWFTSFICIVYFILIGYLYYREDIKRFPFTKRNSLNEMISAPVKQATDPLRMVHELISELGLLIRKAAEDKTIHPELYFSVKQVTKNYLILSSTEFPSKINQYIMHELEIYRLPALSEEELEGLWRP